MVHDRSQGALAVLTLAAQLQIDHICDTDVNDAQEALVPLLELLLVEDLHRNDRGVGDGSVQGRREWWTMR